ncbi:unnamed protein product [Gordionus sp. m RMFG-2023]
MIPFSKLSKSIHRRHYEDKSMKDSKKKQYISFPFEFDHDLQGDDNDQMFLKQKLQERAEIIKDNHVVKRTINKESITNESHRSKSIDLNDHQTRGTIDSQRKPLKLAKVNKLLLCFQKASSVLSPDFQSDFEHIDFKRIAQDLHQGVAILKDEASLVTDYQSENLNSSSFPLTLEIRGDKLNAVFYTDEYLYELFPIEESYDSIKLVAVIPLNNPNNSDVQWDRNNEPSGYMRPHLFKRTQIDKRNLQAAYEDFENGDYNKDKSNSLGFDQSPHPEITGPYTIETIFYAPRKAITFPERSIPFLVGQVNNIFHHPSINADISVILKSVRDYPTNYIEVDNPKTTLANLRKYKLSHAPDIDAAILLSNQIMSPAGVTLGYAVVGSICSKDASALLVQDLGFDTARLIAHEMGHLMGAFHDMGSSCDTGETSGIMHYSPEMHRRYVWSECSAKSINVLLRSNHAQCLLHSEYGYNPIDLPGVKVSSDEQCRKNWGLQYSTEYMNSNCNILKCVRKSNIMDRGLPPLDGTSCKNTDNGGIQLTDIFTKFVCFRGKCIEESSVKSAKRGIWGEWSAWSDCKGFCPMGYKQRTRKCSFNTETKGSFCDGDSEMTKLCKLKCDNLLQYDYKAENQKLCDAQKSDTKFKQNSQYPCLIGCLQSSNLYIFYVPVVDGTPFSSTSLCIQGLVYSE